MPRVTFIEHDGACRTIEAPAGTSIRDVALENGVAGIVGDCGGYCNCGTCHGYVDEAWLGLLPPPSEPERELLTGTASPAAANSRLCCQLPMTEALDGIVVRLPPRQI